MCVFRAAPSGDMMEIDRSYPASSSSSSFPKFLSVRKDVKRKLLVFDEREKKEWRKTL